MGRTCCEHDQRGGDVFELLADLLADARAARRRSRGRAAARGGRRARPACGAGSPASGLRPWPWAGGFAAGGRLRVGLGCGVGLRSGGFEDLAGEEQELVGVELLALAAVALAEELFELMLELGVEVGLLAEGLDQLADEPVGGVEVVGEWVSASIGVIPSIRTPTVDVTENLHANMRNW